MGPVKNIGSSGLNREDRSGQRGGLENRGRSGRTEGGLEDRGRSGGQSEVLEDRVEAWRTEGMY